MSDYGIKIYNNELECTIVRRWTRYGFRLTLSAEMLQWAQEDAADYIYHRFWRTHNTHLLTFGPLHVRELPWEQWEIDLGCVPDPTRKRFEIRHWGWEA